MTMLRLLNSSAAGYSMLFVMLTAWLTITVMALTGTIPMMQMASADKQATPHY
jgi:hypothetical protein